MSATARSAPRVAVAALSSPSVPPESVIAVRPSCAVKAWSAKLFRLLPSGVCTAGGQMR